MSLLKLTPESERLRRIAKAHAAGEIARDEFRRIRSDVIQGFGGAGTSDLGDDTQRRWFASDTTTQPFFPAVEATPSASPKATGPIRMLGLLLITVALALGLALAGAGSAFGLPPEDGANLEGAQPADLTPVGDLRIEPMGVPRDWPFGVPSGVPDWSKPTDADEWPAPADFATFRGRS